MTRSSSFLIRHSTFAIPRRRNGGFALLITITLLAFLVLLLVSLAALTRVETQVANNNQELAQARQNALMALNIALGQLQQTAGPDQRTTAPSVLGENITAITARDVADNGLVTPENGARYWTGVWGNKAAPESLFTRPPQPVLLQWLVSGNETTPAATITAAGQVTTPVAAATPSFNPGQAITEADGSALSVATTAATPLAIARPDNTPAPAALLLGPKTAGDNVDAYVAAPLVNIDSDQLPGLSGPSRIGRYAWWIGDEGVKAKYNLPDPYITNTTPDSSATEESRDSRYRILSAQRNGIERLAAFNNANYPLATTGPTDPLYTAVGNALTPAAIRLASPSADTSALPDHVHDLTTYSHGVLANSQFGGLRRDLTFHLDPRSGDTFLDGRNILPDGATPASSSSMYPESKYDAHPSLFSETTANGGLGFTALDVSPRLGPKWDQIKSYYQIAYDHPVDLEVQPAVDIDTDPSKVTVQAGISPVILETRFLFALRSGPAIDTSIIVVLGNPYTRPLKAGAGLNLRAALHRNNYSDTRQDSEEWGMICNYIGPINPDNESEITSVFTRFVGGFSSSKALFDPPLQQITDPTKYHPHYYPLLKFAPNPSGNGVPDPSPDNPGLLDRVFFQIPAGVLNLAPGEAKAFKLAANPDLGSETVDDVAFQVLGLQEMSDSIPTYFTHPCDPHYLNDSSLLPPGLLTGGAMEEGSRFRLGMTEANRGGIDFILTIPGKPGSVLQSWGPNGMTGGKTSGGQPDIPFATNVFSSLRTAISGQRNYRLFGTAGDYSSWQSTMAPHAEASLLGSFQVTTRLDAPIGSQSRSFLRGQKKSLDGDNFTAHLDSFSATQMAWASGSIDGRSNNGTFLLNDIPAAVLTDEVPILSLGQLQHFDLTADDEALGTAAQPAYAVGNSRYNRLVPRASSRTDLQDNNRSLFFSNSSDTSATALGDSPTWYSGFVPDLPKTTQVRRHDISYLLNTALWDDVFFSTVRPADSGDPASNAAPAPLPANRRFIYTSFAPPTLAQLHGADASAAIPDPASLVTGENGLVPAAQLLVNGAFNVNSTSTEAWTALLSGLRGLGVNNTPATADLTPVARSIRQAAAIVDDQLTYAKAVAHVNTYTGFRALSDTQISTLADEIVKQVKARGPFLSLAQFINRNLTPAAAYLDPVADTGLSGALQQAIDRAGLNAFLNQNSEIPASSEGNAAGYPDNAFIPLGEDASGRVTHGFSSYMAVPGWLNQADLLQSLGPILSARSDTFVIRTYGEVVDPVNSPAAPASPVVKGRAWCEAVVQRLPDYVDNTERPTLHPSQANTTNQTFGRRFRIISFRWLSPDDI